MCKLVIRKHRGTEMYDFIINGVCLLTMYGNNKALMRMLQEMLPMYCPKEVLNNGLK